jgi:hypothetical protein
MGNPDRIEDVAKMALGLKGQSGLAIVEAMQARWPDLTLDEFERGMTLAIERLQARIDEGDLGAFDRKSEGVRL